MLFVTEKKVHAVIDLLLSRSENLTPTIKAIIEHSQAAMNSARSKKAVEIVVDAKLIHEDLLSLGGQFRLRAIPVKAAYYQTEVLQRRMNMLTSDADQWCRGS